MQTGNAGYEFISWDLLLDESTNPGSCAKVPAMNPVRLVPPRCGRRKAVGLYIF